eukprot:gene6106-7330_t
MYWSIDDQYYSGKVAEYREHDAAHLLHHDNRGLDWVHLALQVFGWEICDGLTTCMWGADAEQTAYPNPTVSATCKEESPAERHPLFRLDESTTAPE